MCCTLSSISYSIQPLPCVFLCNSLCKLFCLGSLKFFCFMSHSFRLHYSPRVSEDFISFIKQLPVHLIFYSYTNFTSLFLLGDSSKHNFLISRTSYFITFHLTSSIIQFILLECLLYYFFMSFNSI